MPVCPPLSIALIAQALGPAACRFDLDLLAECDSTNARLLARAEADAPCGTVIVTERQSAGRGRRGRPWFATPGDSLTFSLLRRLPADRKPAGLSLAAGLAVAEALGELGVVVALKWPNDLLRGGGKLGGILVELAYGERLPAVIGVGLNLHLPQTMPTELRGQAAALDMPIDPNEVLARLLKSLLVVLDQFVENGFAPLRERWQALDAYAGRPVRILVDAAPPLYGRAAGVDEDGALLLETATGLQRIVSGEVSLRAA